MVDQNRVPMYGLAVLFAAFLLKDFIFSSESETNEPSVNQKEIPSLHLNRFTGPTITFTFW